MIKINLQEWDLRECLLFGFQINADDFEVLNYIYLLAKHYLYVQKIHNNNNIFCLSFLAKLKNNLLDEKKLSTNGRQISEV